jgi:hypothetical protein
MKMEQIECSETSAYKIQTPGNRPEENIQHTEHGESLKSKKLILRCVTCVVDTAPLGDQRIAMCDILACIKIDLVCRHFCV